MALVKVKNGQVERFPYPLGQLFRDNPSTSFPRNVQNTDLSFYGVYEVEVEDAPAVDEKNYNTVRSEIPVEVSGKWVLQWDVVEKTEEEKQKYYDGFAKMARSNRDTLLSESDWVVAKAYEIGEPVPINWATYRQALRDITAQEGFPYNVSWPTKPE